MADSDSEQQRAKKHINQPYDESVDVGDEEEVASIATPPPRHVEGAERAQSRGNSPPEANMADENYDDEFDTGQPDGEEDYDQDPRMQQIRAQQQQDQLQQQSQQLRGMSGGGQGRIQGGGGKMYGGGDEDDEDDEDEDDDDDEEDDDDDEGSGGAVEGPHYATLGAYDPADYEHLAVTPEIKELFQYITRYTPQTIDLEHKLKPFIPDFIPAVGDIDAFIKIPRPDGKPDTLGLTILDEPCAKQSDPTVLDLQLRAISKQTNVRAMVVKSIEDAEKNPKSVESWITSISEIHRTRPPPNVHYTKNMPDIDALMQEWPSEFEELLKEISLPTADLDCDLAQYVDMICAILDIPIYKSKIQSLHVLFTLYSEFKNSQHFKSLAADNRLDNALKGDGGGGGPIIDDSDRLIL